MSSPSQQQPPPLPPFPSSLLLPPAIDPSAAPVGRPSGTPLTSPNDTRTAAAASGGRRSGNTSASTSPNSGFGSSASGNSSPDPLASGRHSRRGERRQIPKSFGDGLPSAASVSAANAAAVAAATANTTATAAAHHHPLMMNRRDSSPPRPLPSLLASLPSSRDAISSITFGEVLRPRRRHEDSFDLDLTDDDPADSGHIQQSIPTVAESPYESPILAPRHPLFTSPLPPAPTVVTPVAGTPPAMVSSETQLEPLVPVVPPVRGVTPPLFNGARLTPTSSQFNSPSEPVRFLASPDSIATTVALPSVSSNMSSTLASPLPTTTTPPSAAAAAGGGVTSLQHPPGPHHQHSSSFTPISMDYDDNVNRPRPLDISTLAGTPPATATFVHTSAAAAAMQSPPMLHVHHAPTASSASVASIAFPPSVPSSAPTTPKSTANLVNSFPSLIQQDGSDDTKPSRHSAQAIVPSLFTVPAHIEHERKSSDVTTTAPQSVAPTPRAATGSTSEVKEVRWANLDPSTPPATIITPSINIQMANMKTTTPATAAAMTTPKKPTAAAAASKVSKKKIIKKVVPPTIPVLPFPRISPMAQAICWLMDSWPYQIWSVMITIIALLAADFNWAFLPKACDHSTEVILLVCLGYWLAEIIVHCMVRINYTLSFMFWLDLLSSLTLIVDIPLLMDKWAIDDGLLRLLPSAIGITGTGLSGIVRTSSSLRFSLLAPLYRIFRIIRIGRFANYLTHDTRVHLAAPPAHPRKAAYVLHHHLYHATVAGLLVVLLAMTIIDAPNALSSQQFYVRYLPFTMLHSAVITAGSSSTAVASTLSQSFVAFHSQSSLNDLLYLSVNGSILHEDSSKLNDLREMEMDHLMIGASNGNNVTMMASFSLRHDVLVLCAGNFALTISLIIGLLIWHGWTYRLTEWLLAVPLDQFTVIIRRFAGTICLLSAQNNGTAGTSGSGGNGTQSQPATPRGRHNSSFGHSPFPSIGSGGSFGGGTSAGPTLSEVERQVVEGAVNEMTSIFKVHHLGEAERQKARRDARAYQRKRSYQQSNRNTTHTPSQKDKNARRTPRSGGKNRSMSQQQQSQQQQQNDGPRNRGRTLSSVDEGNSNNNNGKKNKNNSNNNQVGGDDNGSNVGMGGWDGTIEEQEEWDRQMGQLSSLHDLGSMRDLELRRTSSSTVAVRSLPPAPPTNLTRAGSDLSPPRALGLSDSIRSDLTSSGGSSSGGQHHVTFGSPSSIRYSVTDGYGRDRYGDDQRSGGSGSGGTRSTFVSPIKSDAKLCPELATFDALLHDQLALQHFRSFLQGRSVGHLMPRPSGGPGKPGLELLLFWQECQAFYHQTIANAVRIFSMFIDSQASTPVPLSEEERVQISHVLGPSLAAAGLSSTLSSSMSTTHNNNNDGSPTLSSSGTANRSSPPLPIDATVIHAGLFAAAERHSARLLRLAYQEFLMSPIADHFRKMKADDRIVPSTNRRSVFIEIDHSSL